MTVLVNTICNEILVSCVSVRGINLLKKRKEKKARWTQAISSCKEIKVENVAESAKIVTNVQTFRDCALHQWNIR